MSDTTIPKTTPVPQKLIDLFGSRELAIEAANIALMYGEHMQEAADDFYWYKGISEKKEIFEEFINEYQPVKF